MNPVEVHCTIEGPSDAPAVVLSGSIGSSLDVWAPQRAALATEYRVISYDHRGHGASPVPPGPYAVADLAADVLALLDRLDIEKAHFCGLSLGGAVGMWLGRHHPNRLDHLVLACTSARFGMPEMWLDRIATVRSAGMRPIAEASVGRWLTGTTVAEHPGLAEAVREMVSATPAEGYTACCAALADWDFAAELPEIPTPTLVIAGADDPATPPEDAVRLAALIPRSRLAVLDRAAHLANVERATEFTDLVRGHLLGARS